MALADKYKDVLELGKKLGMKGSDSKEEGGKFKIWGTTEYQYDKNLIWDCIKTHGGWETEVAADIKVEKTDIYGLYHVKAGDTLSKIAKEIYKDANKYMKIFDANKDQLTNPDLIKVGQKLKLPN